MGNKQSPVLPGREVLEVPAKWALTPTSGKRPYRPNWQVEPPLEVEVIRSELRSGAATGYGVRLGRVSGGLLAVDVDGQSAHELLQTWGDLPATATITSGWSEHRYCLFFEVSPDRWDALATRKYPTGKAAPDWAGKHKAEAIELRWDGAQQVIAGTHPSGSAYHWVRHPSDGVATAPDWLVEKLQPQPQPQREQRQLDRLQAMPRSQPSQLQDRLAAYVSHAIRCEISRVASAPDGDRNNTLNQAAFALGQFLGADWADPYIDRAEIEIALEQAASQCGLPMTEARATIQSGLNAGEREPRERPSDTDLGRSTRRQPTDPVTLAAQLRGAMSKNGSDLEIAVAAIAAQHGLPLQAAHRILGAIERESAREDRRADVAADLDRLSTIGQRRVGLDCLPPTLASAIADRAATMNVPYEALLLPLLAGISSRLNPKSRVQLGKGVSLPPAIWVALVGETGTLKSPVIDLVCGDPLDMIEEQKRQEWQLEYEAWKAAAKRARKSEDGEIPPEPIRQKLIATDGTYEGLLKQLARQGRGELLLYDELESLQANMRRSDRRGDILSLWNGKRLRKQLVGNHDAGTASSYVDVSDPLVCFVGGIQPAKLQQYVAEGDTDGLWSRYLFVYLRNGRKPIDLECQECAPLDNPQSLESLLYRTYSHAHYLGSSPITYYLDDDAKALYHEFDTALIARMETETNESIKAICNKLFGTVGRLAMSLRMLRDSYEQRPFPDHRIDAVAMRGAIQIAEYHLAMAELVYAETKADGMVSIPYAIHKVCELSNGEPISASDLQRRSAYFRKMKSAEIRDFFSEAQALGLGSLEGSGRFVRFRSLPKQEQRAESKTPPVCAPMENFNPIVPLDQGDNLRQSSSRSAPDQLQISTSLSPDDQGGCAILPPNGSQMAADQPQIGTPPGGEPESGDLFSDLAADLVGGDGHDPTPSDAVSIGCWVRHPYKPGRWQVVALSDGQARIVGEVMLSRGLTQGEWWPIQQLTLIDDAVTDHAPTSTQVPKHGNTSDVPLPDYSRPPAPLDTAERW